MHSENLSAAGAAATRAAERELVVDEVEVTEALVGGVVPAEVLLAELPPHPAARSPLATVTTTPARRIKWIVDRIVSPSGRLPSAHRLYALVGFRPVSRSPASGASRETAVKRSAATFLFRRSSRCGCL
jgi:hypothetical protein